jgi:hypothetical protein
MATTTKEQHGKAVSFRAPVEVSVAAEHAAANELISVSDYARRALLRSLKADGIDPAQFTASAA